MHPFEAKQPERLAMHLGYAGLIPFVSGALGVWGAPSGWRPFVHISQVLSGMAQPRGSPIFTCSCSVMTANPPKLP